MPINGQAFDPASVENVGKAVKRDQVKVIFREAEPLAVAVENIRLPNLLASAAGAEKHPGVNVSAKRSLNRSVSEAGMGETNRIIRRECEGAGIPFLPVSAAGNLPNLYSLWVQEPRKPRESSGLPMQELWLQGQRRLQRGQNRA